MTGKTAMWSLSIASAICVAFGVLAADPQTPSGPTKGSKITTPQEQLSWENGEEAMKNHLADMKKDCGFEMPFEVYYAVPMKDWLRSVWAIEFSGNCQDKPAGCLSVFAYCTEIADEIAHDCRNLDQTIVDADTHPPMTAGRALIKSKIKRVVCKAGKVLPHYRPGPGQSYSQFSRMKGAYDSKDGTLTWTIHQSDNNRDISWMNFVRLYIYPAQYRSGYPVADGPHPDVED